MENYIETWEDIGLYIAVTMAIISTTAMTRSIKNIIAFMVRIIILTIIVADCTAVHKPSLS